MPKASFLEAEVDKEVEIDRSNGEESSYMLFRLPHVRGTSGYSLALPHPFIPLPQRPAISNLFSGMLLHKRHDHLQLV